MKLITLLCALLLSACSVQIIDMTPEPTVQKFNLIDYDEGGDGDGVILARDECPDSIPGAKVGNNGCGTETIETLRTNLEVHFDTNKYDVKEEYLAEIKTIADFMIEFPQSAVLIEGHTSITGSAEYNLTLSQNRALAIKDILIEQFDIAESRITAIGYGFTRLLAEGNDEETHAKNRRIVAEISTDKNLIDMRWNIYSVDKEDE
ncbi:OmpA family protein [Psychromonas sp. KJ10-10]|uniref:OmpA family protein n=1 Tax=Psychromonas sp. KJ10-10 TaxID=3391823 RepID=UPI0039B66494